MTLLEEIEAQCKRLRDQNIRPKAVVCGREAYEWIQAKAAWHSWCDHYPGEPSRLFGGGISFMGIDVFLLPGADPSFVRVVYGADGLGFHWSPRFPEVDR